MFLKTYIAHVGSGGTIKGTIITSCWFFEDAHKAYGNILRVKDPGSYILDFKRIY